MSSTTKSTDPYLLATFTVKGVEFDIKREFPFTVDPEERQTPQFLVVEPKHPGAVQRDAAKHKIARAFTALAALNLAPGHKVLRVNPAIQGTVTLTDANNSTMLALDMNPHDYPAIINYLKKLADNAPVIDQAVRQLPPISQSRGRD